MKKTLRKLTALGLAGTMLLGTNTVFAGEEAKEIKDITVFTYVYMDIPDRASIDAVLEEVNRTMNPLGVNVNLELTSASSYWDELNMKLASGETVDLVALTDNRYSTFVKNGSLMDMDELLDEYGQDLLATFGGEEELGWLLDAVKINGARYAVPVLDNKCNWDAISLNNTYLEKYNLDPNDIKTYSDLADFLKVIHENEPTVRAIIPHMQNFSGLSATFRPDPTFENLGDGIGVLLGEDNWDVVDLFETEEYADFCREVHGWFEAGYVPSDIATTTENADAYWKTGNAFSYIQNSSDVSPEVSQGNLTQASGVESTVVQINPAKASFLKFLEVIPVTSKNPDAAMIFLNELYTNKDLLTTWYYGVEGKDWTVENDMITGMEGSTYYPNVGTCFDMMWGNFFLPLEKVGQVPGTRAATYDLMMNCDRTRSLGFYFDASNVSTQMTAVQNVLAEYEPGLEFGLLDPDVEIPNFIEALKAAGIDDIIAEKQAQLDAWVEVNGK